MFDTSLRQNIILEMRILHNYDVYMQQVVAKYSRIYDSHSQFLAV